jgi:hypothetical protein
MPAAPCTEAPEGQDTSRPDPGPLLHVGLIAARVAVKGNHADRSPSKKGAR